MAMRKSPYAKVPKRVKMEALDMFTVKRKRGKPSGQYESQSIKMGNASYRRPKR